jgi:putative FmdB family regulatory protein
MPLYEYTCTQCGHVFEHLARFDEMYISQTCPECKVGRADRTEISNTHFELKGRGWNRLAWDRFK